MIHAEITISGVVQGVGFRYFTRQTARAYGINGFVKNLPNGKVYCEAEAERNIIQAFVKELKVGPTMSRVADVRVNEFEDLENFKTFKVRF